MIKAFDVAEDQALSWSRPTSISGFETLAYLFHANGYLEEARQSWEALEMLRPDNGRYTYYLADLAQMTGNEAAMLGYMQKTAELEPAYAPTWLKLGSLYFNTNNIDEAISAFQKRLELQPKDSYAATYMARIELRRNNEAKARQWLDKAVNGDPDIPTSHNLLANILRKNGDPLAANTERWRGSVLGRFREAADPWKEELIRKYCYDVNKLLIRADIDQKTRYKDFGLSLMLRAQTIEPNNPAPYKDLGSLYLEQGKVEKALEILEEGHRLPDATPDMSVQLAEAYQQSNQLKKGLELLSNELLSHPDEPSLLIAYGSILDSLGRYQEAIDAFKEAIQGNQQNKASSYLKIAISLLHMGKKEEAKEHLLKALEEQPQFPFALAELGGIELNDWNLEAAEKYISEFYNNYPVSKRAGALMVQLHVRKTIQAIRNEKLELAEQYAKEGLTLFPESVELNSVLGMLYAQQNRVDEAAVTLEKANQSETVNVNVLLSLIKVYMSQGKIEQAKQALRDGEQKLLIAGETEVANKLNELLLTLSYAKNKE